MPKPLHKTHALERRVNMLQAKMEDRIEALTYAFQGGSTTPPFTVRLSKQEQLEQYWAMDEEKWKQVIQQYGIKGATEYSQAMQKLIREENPDTRPGYVMLPPENRIADAEQAVRLAADPKMQPAPDPTPADLANALPINLPRGATPEQQYGTENPEVQKIVEQALQGTY